MTILCLFLRISYNIIPLTHMTWFIPLGWNWKNLTKSCLVPQGEDSCLFLQSYLTTRLGWAGLPGPYYWTDAIKVKGVTEQRLLSVQWPLPFFLNPFNGVRCSPIWFLLESSSSPQHPWPCSYALKSVCKAADEASTIDFCLQIKYAQNKSNVS